MNNDLKVIKKYYGEEMLHFCKSELSTLLDINGKLPKVLLENFYPSNNLIKDIKKEKVENCFINFLYSFINKEFKKIIDIKEKPKKIFDILGYDFYECKTEEEIQSFKKYYSQGEELCTFNGGRLDKCYVFFAVKKNVSKIKRENFTNPVRQDEYGTSVISIQFTKNENNFLSIKNRYNHTVENPDSTFFNDLDNIYPGLTESFSKFYGLKQKIFKREFDLPGYIKVNDNRLYKYNYKINNIYYCPNNIIIDNLKVIKYQTEKNIILDYFIIDLVNKKISLYDNVLFDSFINLFDNIENIKINNNTNNKNIKVILKNNNYIDLTIDNENRLIKLIDYNSRRIENNFLIYNNYIKEIILNKAISIENNFLADNNTLNKFLAPNVEKIENNFLENNFNLKDIKIPNVKVIKDNFLKSNNKLNDINLPNVFYIGNMFLYNNNVINNLELPMVYEIGDCFLQYNNAIKTINFPNLRIIKDAFLSSNIVLNKINLPNIIKKGKWFLNEDIKKMR